LRIRFWLLLLYLIAASLYLVRTAGQLPTLVASHFGASGAANGFMPRTTYVSLMLLITLGVPLLLAILPGVAIRMPGARINLPHRDYWLAPERADKTVDRLSGYMTCHAIAVGVFLCYAQGLVVRANGQGSPHLSSAAMVAGLLVLLTFVAGSLIHMWRSFAKPD